MSATPEQQLATFMAAFDPAIVACATGALATLRKRLRGALELVYDNYNALVIAFGPTDRASDIILSIALYPRWVTMFFLHGARLPDPEGRLAGSGSQIRGLRLEGPKTLDEPAVRELIAAAVAQAPVALDPKQPRRLSIRTDSPKKRARRPR